MPQNGEAQQTWWVTKCSLMVVKYSTNNRWLLTQWKLTQEVEAYSGSGVYSGMELTQGWSLLRDEAYSRKVLVRDGI